MKQAIKLATIVVLEIALLVAISGYFAVRSEERLDRSQMESDARLWGSALRVYVAETWRSDGETRALQLLERANREQSAMQIRWVWLDGRADPRFQPLASREAIAAAASGDEVALAAAAPDGRQYFCIYIPLQVPLNRPGAIELAQSRQARDSLLRRFAVRNLELGLALITLGTGSIVWLGVVMIGRPLRRLASQARRIGQGDLSCSPVPRSGGEVAELARSMNDMCLRLGESQQQVRAEHEQRIAAIEQLRLADRLSTIGRLAAGVAHELGTPINTISLRAARLAAENPENGHIREAVGTIKSQCQRMAATIRDLLTGARPRPPRWSDTDLRQVVRQTVKLLEPLAAKYDATLTLSESNEPCEARVDADQIQQVLTNLLVNALQAGPHEGSRIEVDVRPADPPGASGSPETGPWTCISVRDNGSGIAPENENRIFDPFFSTKDVSEGTGLGLPIADGIVKEHGGWIDVTSRPDEGSCFSVYLPAVAISCALR